MIRYILLLVILFAAGFAHSQSYSVVIDSISIQGNKRSSSELILNELTFAAGEEVNQEEIETSIQFIKDREFFSEVRWELQDHQDSSKILSIQVRDKWTLYPILYYSGTNESSHFMLGVMDWNFLGRGIFMMTSYSMKFQQGLDPQHAFNLEGQYKRIGGSRWGPSLNVSSNANANYILRNNMESSSYTQRSNLVSMGVDYNYNNRIIPRLTIAYCGDRFDTFLSESEEQQAEYQQLRFEAGVDFDYLSVVDHRYKGIMAGIGYTFNHDLKLPSFSGFQGVVQAHTLSKNRRLYSVFQGQVRFSNASMMLYNPTFEGMLRGSTGKSYFYSHVAGANLELGITPVRKKWLTLDLVMVGDLARGWNTSDNFREEPWRYRYGAGVRISSPLLQGLMLCVDLVRNEYNQLEAQFGMMRFID